MRTKKKLKQKTIQRIKIKTQDQAMFKSSKNKNCAVQ